MIGKTLSHYRILEKIGAGGMGEVYRTRDERLERDVALKVLPTGTLADEAARKRFRREALALSKLNHPNIQTVFDFDTQDGLDFLVTEYVAGASLDEKLAGGPMTEKEIVRLGMQLAEGLAAAHAERVVHRDLKPRNLRLTPDGRLKILDFGLAKLLRPAEERAIGEGPTESASLTQAVVGTLPYMAPDQLRGEGVDHRSDIWAAGVVLYEMATGRRPFEEKLVSALTDAILHQPPPPPGRLRHDLSARLEEIILKCLEKDPNNRYQSAQELAVDLRRLTTPAALPIAPSPQAPAWGRVLQRRFALAAVALVAVVAVVAVLLGLDVGRLRERLVGAGTPKIDSLAVLPLKNLMGDPEQEYFVEGMHEALITELSKISALKVISRTSTMRYKDTDKPLPQVAQELNVDGVIEGSVLRDADQVRITVQLIHGPTDKHLWAESYQRELRGILALQSEVARAVARQIQIAVTPSEEAHLARALPVNPEAHEAYLLGRFYLEKRTPEALEKALAYFRQALERDPRYAPAYTGLADYYAILPFYSRFSPREVFPQAKAAAQKALELDSSLAEAHASLAYARAYYDWEWSDAEQGFRRALELNPNSSNTRQAYSRLLAVQGRVTEAVAEMERARDLDPLSLLPTGNLGMLAYFAGDSDLAIAHLQETLQHDPNFPVAHWGIGLAYEQKGQYEQAIAAFQKAHNLVPGNLNILASLGHTYALLGRRDEAEKIIAQLKEESQRKYVSSYQIALVYAGLGNKEQALDWLERAYDERSTLLAYARMDPRMSALRKETRFQDLLRRMNLPEN